jgi:hypothetical protein
MAAELPQICQAVQHECSYRSLDYGMKFMLTLFPFYSVASDASNHSLAKLNCIKVLDTKTWSKK